MSKGSVPRPFNKDLFDENFTKIFGDKHDKHTERKNYDRQGKRQNRNIEKEMGQ